MGGKVWSKEEEEVFWTQMMVQSPKRLPTDQNKYAEKTWHQIAREMTEIMGDNARRKYTGLGVCTYPSFSFALLPQATKY